MADVAGDAQHEFWRPPIVQSETTRPGLVEVCDGCHTEFMVGSQFCHLCGTARGLQASTRHLTVYLEFHNIKRALGLSTAALIAFFIGVVCLLMAGVAVGLIYSIQTFNDFQAVQLYRMQWLLGAVAAFIAGLLLKKTPKAKQ